MTRAGWNASASETQGTSRVHVVRINATFVKSLEDRNLVSPVVRDFGFRDGGFRQFAANVALLPTDERSVFARSFFMGGHPQSVAGYHATQLVP